MRFIVIPLFAVMFCIVARSEADSPKTKPEAKSKSDAKDKKAEPESRLNMKMTTADINFGSHLMGPKVDAVDLKGHVVLVDYWGVNCPPCRAAMPRTAALYSELADFGLIVLGSHVQNANADEVRTVARSLGASFPISSQTRVAGSEDSNGLPHCILFDHSGKCIFRGLPGDVERLIRTSVGQALVDGAARDKFSATLTPLVQDLKKGRPPVTLLPRVVALQSSNGDVGAEAKALLSSMTTGGLKKMEKAEAIYESEPLEAFLLVEKIPLVYKGTPVAHKASEMIAKLKRDKTVTAEIAARASLESIRKIEQQLSVKLQTGDPKKSDFQKANASLLKQLKDKSLAMRKSWPDARATQEALLIAEKFEATPK